jgi:hypothetical protein
VAALSFEVVQDVAVSGASRERVSVITATDTPDGVLTQV